MSEPLTDLSPLEWHTERRRLGDLRGWPFNPRRLTEKQAADLQASLDRFNYVELAVINLGNTLIAGHQRTALLLRKHGPDRYIEVRVPNRSLSDDELAEYNVRSNKNAGEWDWDILANKFDQDALQSWGFESWEFGIVDQADDRITNEGSPEAHPDADFAAKYLDGGLKQFVMMVTKDQYEPVTEALSRVRDENGLKDNSEAFLFLLSPYASAPLIAARVPLKPDDAERQPNGHNLITPSNAEAVKTGVDIGPPIILGDIAECSVCHALKPDCTLIKTMSAEPDVAVCAACQKLTITRTEVQT